MGIFKPTGTSTVYVQEFSWKRSPEIWKGVGKYIIMAFIAGMFFWATVVSGSSDSKAKPTPAVTVRVTVTHTVLPNLKEK